MTIEELHNLVKTDAGVQAEFEAAVDNGTLVQFAASKGVNASEEELIQAFQA